MRRVEAVRGGPQAVREARLEDGDHGARVRLDRARLADGGGEPGDADLHEALVVVAAQEGGLMRTKRSI